MKIVSVDHDTGELAFVEREEDIEKCDWGYVIPDQIKIMPEDIVRCVYAYEIFGLLGYEVIRKGE